MMMAKPTHPRVLHRFTAKYKQGFIGKESYLFKLVLYLEAVAAAVLFLPASMRKIFLLEQIWSLPLTWSRVLIRMRRRPGDLSWGQCSRLEQRWGLFYSVSECSLCLSWLNSLQRVVPGSRASVAGGLVHPPDFRSRSCRKWGHSLSTWPVWFGLLLNSLAVTLLCSLMMQNVNTQQHQCHCPYH